MITLERASWQVKRSNAEFHGLSSVRQTADTSLLKQKDGKN